MQVPQRAGLIPIGLRVELGLRAMSLWWVRDTDTSKDPEFLYELAGSSRVYVSRAILIKCAPT